MLLGRVAMGIFALTVLFTCAAKADEPQAPLASLTVPDGFVIESAALPPLVKHPMMAGFDDNGRLYVAESAGRNLERPELEAELPNFVRRLVDTDGDGVFDQSTIFADKMTYPMGALWHQGSLYVASPPSIWKLTDTDEDGVADLREEIVGQFGYIGNAADIHGCFLGPEGRIYWCDGRHGHRFTADDGTVTSEGQAARIFSCMPDGSDVQIHCGGGMDNPVEVDFTPEGEMLGTVNLFFEKRGDCLVHWMHGGAYPRRDQLKVLEELKRTGDLLGPVLDMGHVAVSGTTRYRSGIFGDEYHDNYFVCEFNTHKVRRLVVNRQGSSFTAQSQDFFATDRIDFHPTDVLEDADGSLLVVDTGGWFRYGCPTSQIAKPEILGGIYRIRKRGAASIPDPRGTGIPWKSLSVEKLIELLADKRFAVRQRAKEQLIQRGADGTDAMASKLASQPPKVRAELGWVFAQLGTPAARAELRLLLADESPSVRQVAVHALGTLKDVDAVPRLGELVVTDEPPVRREAATSLGKIGRGEGVAPIFTALRSDMDRTLEHALIYALIEIQDLPATFTGLRDSSPAVRRAALLAIDQIEPAALARDDVTPLLDTDDVMLQSLALEVIGKRPQWSGEIVSLLEEWLGDAALPMERHAMLRGVLIAFATEQQIQQVVATALMRRDLSPSTQRLVLDAMGRCRLRTLPALWVEPIGKALAASDDAVVRDAVHVLGKLDSRAHDAQLEWIGNDARRPEELRTAALATFARHGNALSKASFEYLSTRTLETAPPTERMAAADGLGAATLTDQQRLKLATIAASATSLELPLLFAALERSPVVETSISQAWLTALQQAPGLESLRAEQIAKAFADISTEQKPELESVMAKLRSHSSDQVAKLDELSRVLIGGDKELGKAVFFGKRTACFACHRIGDQGGIIGPDLSAIGKIRTRRDLTEAIAFPSSSLARGYQSYSVALTNGEIVTGVLAKESSDAIFLRNTKREELRIDREEVESLTPTSASVMPQGLDKTMTVDEFRHLLAYLESLQG